MIFSGDGFPSEVPLPITGAAAAAVSDAGGRLPHLIGRTPQDVARIAAHESGHAITARALGSIVELLTIRPADGFAGQCLRRGGGLNLLDAPPSGIAEVADIVEVATRLGRPPLGVSRIDVAEGSARAMTLIIELLGGHAAERIMFADLCPLPAPHDDDQAAALASTIALNADALVTFAAAEAETIIRTNADVLAALTDRLVEVGTLTGTEVDEVIGRTILERQIAEERKRRLEWAKRIEGARQFEKLREA